METKKQAKRDANCKVMLQWEVNHILKYHNQNLFIQLKALKQEKQCNQKEFQDLKENFGKSLFGKKMKKILT